MSQWAAAIEGLDYDSRSDNSFGMKQRPDGDIEIDEKFWEEDFHLPTCSKCNGVLKPDVRHFAVISFYILCTIVDVTIILHSLTRYQSSMPVASNYQLFKSIS